MPKPNLRIKRRSNVSDCKIEKFIKQADRILIRLGLPALYDDKYTSEEEYLDECNFHRINLYFPNLCEEERAEIAKIRSLATVVIRSIIRQEFVRLKRPHDLSLDEAATAALRAEQEWRQQKEEMDKSGMRARLSEFQEQLLEYLMDLDTQMDFIFYQGFSI